MSKSVIDSARSRVSIRKYTDQPLTHAQIEEIIDAARRAPSAWNIQPWHFYAVTNQETKNKLQEAAMGQPQVGNAAVLFVLASDMKKPLGELEKLLHPSTPSETKDYFLSSVGGYFSSLELGAQQGWGRNQSYIALGYLLLVLESLGYASSPMLGFNPDAVKTILGLDADVEIPALVAVGYPAAEGHPQHRYPVSEVLTIIE